MKKIFVSILLTFFTLLSFPIAHSQIRVQELSTSKYKPHVFTLVYDGDIADNYEKEKKLLKKNNKKLCNFRVTIRSVDEKLLTKRL